MLQIVAAVTNDTNGIGYQGRLPWFKCEADMKRFRALTRGSPGDSLNAVIMGRITFESIGSMPLEGRLNVVVSSQSIDSMPSEASLDGLTLSNTNVKVCPSFASAVDYALEQKVQVISAIGGHDIFAAALAHPLCQRVYLSRIYQTCACDVFFPRLINWDCIESSESSGCRFETFVRSEHQYIQLVQETLKQCVRPNRSEVATLSQFGTRLRFSLQDHQIPLLTTKRVFWRGVVQELLWFIRGSTSAKELQQQNIHIWDGHSSRSFLDTRNLHHYEEGELGPVYGFQWRFYGARYPSREHGIDQLAECIRLIREDPTSRRIIMHAWNPVDLPKMALPPCHLMCQFYVNQNTLDCQVYQRSADIGLGVPFNIASYALLTHMIATVCDLEAGVLTMVFGDTHIYVNHVEALQTQITRPLRPFPRLYIQARKCIDSFCFEDFTLIGYDPHEKINMTMVV
jgi:dihydrofolate reductase/thymidylate synthase